MLTKNLPLGSKFFRTLISFGVLFLILTLSSASGAAASKTKVLFQFTGSSGSDPFAGPTLDAAGNIYGTTTYLDGTDGAGTVFKLSQNSDGTWTRTILTEFSAGGENPSSPVIFDAAGNLYGTTYGGGDFGVGTVFELSPNPDGTWTETVLHSFTGADGAYPGNGGLVFDSAGNFYGTTFYQAGVGNIFELSPNSDGSWTESSLYTFCRLANCADGVQPVSGLILDKSGNLYGMTPAGGSTTCIGNEGGGCGVVFELSRQSNGSWKQTVLHTFAGGTDGSYPASTLVFDKSGNLYGATIAGGTVSCNCGTVFELTPKSKGGWTESVLHRFTTHGPNGPRTTPIFDAAGNLYGAATFGGPAGTGGMFKMAPKSGGGWTYSVLHVFLGQPATGPASGIAIDKSGNLFGTGGCGNSACEGTVFEVTP